MKKVFFFIFIFFNLFYTFAQDIDIGEVEILSVRKKEWDVFASIHTNGLGMGVHVGKQKSIHYKSGFEIELSYYKHLKEQRAKTTYSIENYNNKSFIYGKLNHFLPLYIGYGFTRIINQKPYWGGINTGYFLYGGASVGFSVPIYLDIIRIIDNSRYELKTERYDPNLHSLSNIYSGTSFFKGISKTKIHPGLYIKTGFSFDFSAEDAKIMALDFGVIVDSYFPPVNTMAFTKDKYFFIKGFIAFHLGRKLTNYE
ncbi:MAG: hypothetical protein GX330_07710 [Bacteroidales bacterium]|nr:hypothetical protein [Bacteroidales bacterium]